MASRKIENRPEFQKTIEEACNEINEQFNSSLYTDFKTTKGLDEIGGVLTDISDIFRIITSILDYIYPYKIRFALACGYVDTGLETKDITKMDGPAFHKAASGITNLKETGLLFNCLVDDMIIDSAIEGEINLILMIKNNWKPKQYQIVKEYNKVNNQSQAAKKLNISQSLVWRTLEKLNWEKINYIEENLNRALDRYQQKMSGWREIERNSVN